MTDLSTVRTASAAARSRWWQAQNPSETTAMTETQEIEETCWEWGAPDADLCTNPQCGGVLGDYSSDTEARDVYGLPMGHSATWRQCGRCGIAVDLRETNEEGLESWAVA